MAVFVQKIHFFYRFVDFLQVCDDPLFWFLKTVILCVYLPSNCKFTIEKGNASKTVKNILQTKRKSKRWITNYQGANER